MSIRSQSFLWGNKWDGFESTGTDSLYLTGGTDLFLPFLPLFVAQYKERKVAEVGNHALNQNAGYEAFGSDRRYRFFNDRPVKQLNLRNNIEPKEPQNYLSFQWRLADAITLIDSFNH